MRSICGLMAAVSSGFLRFVTIFFGAALLAAQGLAPPPAAVSSVESMELADFDGQSEGVRSLISESLKLTKLNLTYLFSSHEPDAGGMDCSGTIYHLLRKCGHAGTPRQSDQICQWVIDGGGFHRTESTSTLNDAVWAHLRVGDLVFWSGTYKSTERKLPVTHVMLYLGKRASDGKPLLFGASDGRTYDGQRRCGVSVFDFVIPKQDSKSAIYGYGRIPSLRP